MSLAPIVCPFCPLHCDDMDPVRLNTSHTGCHVADQRMAYITRAVATKIDPIDWETCLRWLETAKRVVVTGYVIDLETSRAISEFANITGAEIDVVSTNAAAQRVFAREGAFLTTLSELSAREVSVLVIGDVAAHWPRIEERLGKIKSIERWSDSADLPSRIARLRTQAAGRFIDGAGDNSEITSALNLVKTASYLVVLVAPLTESIAGSSALWSSLLGLVRERNKTSRAAILSFDPSITLRSVMAARNDPSPFNFPVDKTALQIEFSPFGPSHPQLAGRSIVIGMTDKKLSEQQRLLPASVPGLHHAGIVIRGDGSVTLPLQSCLTKRHESPTLPTPAEQLRRLLNFDPQNVFPTIQCTG